MPPLTIANDGPLRARVKLCMNGVLRRRALLEPLHLIALRHEALQQTLHRLHAHGGKFVRANVVAVVDAALTVGQVHRPERVHGVDVVANPRVVGVVGLGGAEERGDGVLGGLID